MFAGLAPARRRLLLAVLGVVVAALVTVGVVALVPRHAAVADQSRPGPVLLVPGYGGSTGSLQQLADRIGATGRDATVVSLPGDGTGDLRASAAVLGDAVRAAIRRTGASSVDVVGYSAGGIVARLWVADGGGAALARRVVTLGSPHHGTELADLAVSVAADPCPEACRQLAGDSDLLRRLNAGDETPAGPTWVSIWTTQDRTVTPPDSARLAGAVNLPVQSVCADASVDHGGLPRSPLVQAMVLAELGAGEPVALTPADCRRLRS
ncbi:lipase family alpha/beta hydrolase [Nakamurella endophytica]|uniref:lipase family alpha/beta hydrolase n=1 Tax=Nakamurella endophytica TaxID=1748367 RepID=UPI00166AB5B5|nr:alpha/beta fold hydrolase [Nakamurella endophytica]